MKPRLRKRHAALRPAMPPPTMTTGNFSVLVGGEKEAWSRSWWPSWADSLTKEPAIGRSDFRERPIRAALVVVRKSRRRMGWIVKPKRRRTDRSKRDSSTARADAFAGANAKKRRRLARSE